MAEFVVNTDALRTGADNMQNLQRQMSSIAARLTAVQIGRVLQGNYTAVLNSKIRDCGAAVVNQTGNLRNLANGLDVIASLYDDTEKKLSDPKTSDQRENDGIFANLIDWSVRPWFLITVPPAWRTDWPFLLLLRAGAVLGAETGGGFPSSGSVLSGTVSGSGSLWGIPASGTLEGSLLGYKFDTVGKAEWNLDKGEAGLKYGGKLEAYGAKGSASGNYGLLGGELEGSAGNLAVTGTVNATLFEDGKFSPSIGAELKGEASVLEGEATGYVGSEDNNVHVKGEGTVLGAEAKAEGKVGVITTEDAKTGETVTSYGVSGSVSAEAYVAEGKVSGGITIFGIDIDVGVSGKAGGAGVEAGGSVTTNGLSGEVGAGLGLGAGLQISVDWSDFDPPTMEEIGDGLENLGDAIIDFFTW